MDAAKPAGQEDAQGAIYIPCALVDDGGRMWQPEDGEMEVLLSESFNMSTLMDSGSKFTVVTPHPNAVEQVRAGNARQLLLFQLPAADLTHRPSSSAIVKIGDYLGVGDTIKLLSAEGRRGLRVMSVAFGPGPSAVPLPGPSAVPLPSRATHGAQHDGQHDEAQGGPTDERAYLGLLREVAGRSVTRADRTGTGTLSVFGRQVRFALHDGLPLLTTKKLAWRKVLEELLWFARGETDVRDLQQRGVRIWDGNSSRAFLDAVGLHGNAEGDIGPAYGFQWRHFGADYDQGPKSGDDKKYAGAGFDQLAEVERLLKHDPMSRRIVMSAWNPPALRAMALPPCHVLCQFYVDAPMGATSVPRLSCHLYQRSVDTFLGFPWNIASYSMLTCILAERCGMQAHELIISTGDTHVYTDHLDAVHTQLSREPRPKPVFMMSADVASKAWHELSLHDFDVAGYYPHGFIAAKMSV